MPVMFMFSLHHVGLHLWKAGPSFAVSLVQAVGSRTQGLVTGLILVLQRCRRFWNWHEGTLIATAFSTADKIEFSLLLRDLQLT